MTKGITNRQMFFILLLTLSAYVSISLPKISAQAMGRSGWISILAMALIFALAAAVIAKLGSLFPGKALFEYSREIGGKFVSRALAVFYLLYFMFIALDLKLQLIGLLSSNFLPKTPEFALLTVSVALFGFVAYKGIVTVARLLELYGIAFLITTVAICVIMLPQGMIYNILPLINSNDLRGLLPSAPKFVFAYGGIEVLAVIPFTRENRKAPLVCFCTLLFIGLLYVLIVESTISILGIHNTIIYRDSFIEAIKVVNISVIERMDIFYLTVGLTGLFAGLISAYMAILEYACKLFPKLGRPATTFAVCALLYGLGLISLSICNPTMIFEQIAPYLIMATSILLPCALLIAARARGLPQAGDKA